MSEVVKERVVITGLRDYVKSYTGEGTIVFGDCHDRGGGELLVAWSCCKVASP